MSEDKTIDIDEFNIKWIPVDETSIVTNFLGKSYRTGPWKKSCKSKIYDCLEVCYFTLDYNTINGDVKIFLEYKDERKLLIIEGKFDKSIPYGIHIAYLPDKDEKKTEWITRKYFDKKKTGILLSYDKNVKGKEETKLKCKNPNPPSSEEKEVFIRKENKTVKQLQEELKSLGILFTTKEKKSLLEEKLKAYIKSKHSKFDN